MQASLLFIVLACCCLANGDVFDPIPISLTYEGATYDFDWSDFSSSPRNHDGCQEIVAPWTDYSSINFKVTIPSDFVGDFVASIAPLGTSTVDDSQELYVINVSPFAEPVKRGGINSMGVSQTYSVTTGSTNEFLVSIERSVETTESLPYRATFTLKDYCNSGSDDPIFVGLNGQKFNFPGHRGSIYHLFSDEHISLNTLFVEATAKHRGTVLGAHGIHFGNTTIAVNFNSRLDNGSLSLVVDGSNRLFQNKYVGVLDNCVDVEWRDDMLTLANPTHRIDLKFISRRNSHIDKKHIDFILRHPAENVANVGGLLGQTVFRTAQIVKDEAKFITSDLLSLNAITNVFQGLPLECQKQSVQRRSARSELTRACK